MDERRHEPTSRRRERARREGRVPLSRSLTGALVLTCVAASATALLGACADPLLACARRLWSNDSLRLDLGDAGLAPIGVGWGVLLAGILLAAIAATLAQTRGALRPWGVDISRASPARNLANWTSRGADATWDALSGLLIGVVGVMGSIISWHWHGEQWGALVELDTAAWPRAAGDLLRHHAMEVGVTLVVCGLADYAWRWWRHERALRMTDRELRDEQRDEHGDPGTRRERARRAAKMRDSVRT